jgi:hypothetical protein
VPPVAPRVLLLALPRFRVRRSLACCPGSYPTCACVLVVCVCVCVCVRGSVLRTHVCVCFLVSAPLLPSNTHTHHGVDCIFMHTRVRVYVCMCVPVPIPDSAPSLLSHCVSSHRPSCLKREEYTGIRTGSAHVAPDINQVFPDIITITLM